MYLLISFGYKKGTLYIGIRNDVVTVGVEDIDGVMLQVASLLKDTVKSDIMPFVQIKAIKRDSKMIVYIINQLIITRNYMKV